MPAVRVHRTVLHAVALLVAVTGCGGSDAPAPAARIDLSSTSVTLNPVGATTTVTAAVKDASGGVLSSAPVTWSSDVPSVATVTASGASATITGVASGTTTVRATSGAASATVSVQVAGVRSVTVNPTTTAIRVGDTQGFTATVAADAGVSTAVTWSSTNPAVVSISATGVVTGVSIGSTTVRATSVADSKFSATATVTVSAQRTVVVTPTSGSIIAGQALPLTATVQIDAGLSTAVTWRTSAAAIATVNATGVVTGVSNGAAVITAVAVGDTLVRATANITVLPSVRAVAVTPATASVFWGVSQQFAATVAVDGALGTSVTWRSSNLALATISATGLATTTGIGVDTITAVSTADTTKRAIAVLTVLSRPTTVSIVQRNVSINPGTSTTMTGMVLANPLVSTAVTWATSASGVATVSNAGVVTGIANGSTLITATSQADPTKRDTLTVSVIPTLASAWTPSRLSGPLYEDILSIVSFNASSAFAINFIGDVYRWNGTTWALSLRRSTDATKFNAIHGNTAGNVFAVGDNGAIARFDGTQWTQMQSGTTASLYGIFVEPTGRAYVVGANGTALQLSLGVWSATATRTSESLYGVWSANGVAYAVGSTGTALRFDGSTWTSLSPPTSESLNAISGTSGTDIVAVGSYGTVMRFNGATWSFVSSNNFGGDMWAINTSAANGGRSYIAGDDGLLQLDGSNLAPVVTPYTPRMFGVSVDQAGTVWLGGQRGVVERNGGSGATWETLNIAPDLLDVWSSSTNNAWAVGEFGFTYRWNGTVWTRQGTPTLSALSSVWSPSQNDAFAGGDRGVMLRWNGSSWTTLSFPSTANITAIWGSGANNVFATTDAGEIARFNGSAWSIVTTTVSALGSIFGVSPTEVYAGGEGGLILRFNGTNWTPLPAPANGTIAGLWMTGPTNIIAVGADGSGNLGLSYRFDGNSWQAIQLVNNRVFTTAWGAALTDVFITGETGTLLRYNGSSWQPIITGTTDLLWSVSGAPNGVGAAFAVGYNSTVVVGSNGGSPIMAAITSPAVGTLEPSPAARRFRSTARSNNRTAISGISAGPGRISSRMNKAATSRSSSQAGGPRRERTGRR